MSHLLYKRPMRFTATELDAQEVIRRAELDPKPLYYRDEFLDEQLDIYKRENSIEYVALIEPDDFVRWVFPRLFYSRLPRYQAIADHYGYTVSSSEVAQVKDESDFLRLVETALERQG